MNETVTLCSSRWDFMSMAYIIPRGVVMFVGTLSNIVLVIVLIKDPIKCLRNSSSYLIMNLAFSDILTNLAWFLVQFLRLCINGFSLYPLIFVAPYVGFFSIVAMAFDRYMSCVHPFKYRTIQNGIRTLTFAFTCIFFLWLHSLGLVAFQIIFANDKRQIYARCGIGLLVLFGAVIMYGKAAYVLKNNSRYLNGLNAVSSTAQNKAHHGRLVNEKRLLTTMFFVSVITITTVGPPVIYTVAISDISYTHVRSKKPIHFWLDTLFLVNYSINPFIYIWRLKNYRRAFKIVLKELVSCNI